MKNASKIRFKRKIIKYRKPFLLECINHVFWPYIYLDSSRILVYQYTVPYILFKSCFIVHLFPSKFGFNECIPVQGITVIKKIISFESG